MSVFEKMVSLPDYYPTMEQDGYEPWQVLEAFRRTQRKQLQEEDDFPRIHITSEVKIKREFQKTQIETRRKRKKSNLGLKTTSTQLWKRV